MAKEIEIKFPLLNASEIIAKLGEEDNRGYPYNLLIQKGLYKPH